MISKKPMMQPMTDAVLGMSDTDKAESALKAAGWVRDVYGWQRGLNTRTVRVTSYDVKRICTELTDGECKSSEIDVRIGQ